MDDLNDIIAAPYSTRIGKGILAQIDHIDSVLKATTDDKTNPTHSTQKTTFENIYKTFNPVVRPPTPCVDVTDTQQQQQINNPIILFQSLIRGRAVQNEMYQGKEKRLQMLKELKTKNIMQTHEIDQIPNQQISFVEKLGSLVSNSLLIQSKP